MFEIDILEKTAMDESTGMAEHVELVAMTGHAGTQAAEMLRSYALYNVAMNFIGEYNLEDAMGASVEILGKYLRAGNVRIYRKTTKTDSFECFRRWKTNGPPARMLTLSEDAFYALKNGECCVVDGQSADSPERRHLATALSASCYILAPIQTGKELWGFMEADVARADRYWSAADVNTVQKIAGIIAAGTEKDVREKEADAMRETLRGILDHVPSCVFWKDRNSVYRGCNSAFSNFFGISPHNVEGKKDFDFLPAPLAKKVVAHDQRVVQKQKQLAPIEYHVGNATGEDRWLRVTRVPLKDGTGKVSLLLGILDDITQEKEARKHLEQRDKILERAIEEKQRESHAKSEFLSGISHEMRTPLNAVLGMTYIAKESRDLARIKYCLDKIESSATRLLDGINGVLDLSKIEADKLELASETFCLERMLINICNIITVRAHEKGQSLEISIASDVPVNFVGDEARLSQVIMNLLSNAVKFTPESGTVTMEVSVLRQKRNKTVLQVMVEDTGIGISQEMLGRLFEPFEQEKGITPKFGGTGLGLSIAKRIVGHMGGTIRAESVKGKGSRFIATFELETAPVDERAQLCEAIRGRRPRILVIDASSADVRRFQEALEQGGVDLVTADSRKAVQALMDKDVLRSKPFDIIFIDAGMAHLAQDIEWQQGAQNFVLLMGLGHMGKANDIEQMLQVRKVLSKPLFSIAIIETVSGLMGGIPQESALSGEIPDLSDKRILLAEDVYINKEVVCAFLEKTGVQIDWESTGRSALKRFACSPGVYDLVLMDIRMPDMDGYQATRGIRKVEKKKGGAVPVIAMTANVFQKDIDRCFAAGMNDYLTKPINPERAVEKVVQYLCKQEETRMRCETPQETAPLMGDISELGWGLENSALYAKLLKSFVKNRYQASLEQAWKNNDTEKLAFFTHKMKGVAGNLSLTCLYEAAQEFESALEAGDAAEDQLVGLIGILRQTVEEIRHSEYCIGKEA